MSFHIHLTMYEDTAMRNKAQEAEKKYGGVSFLAARLGVSDSTIYAAIRNRLDLPNCLQIGSRKVWRAEIIDAWRKKKEAKPTTNIKRCEAGSKGGRKSRTIKNTKHCGRPTKQEQVERRG